MGKGSGGLRLPGWFFGLAGLLGGTLMFVGTVQSSIVRLSIFGLAIVLVFVQRSHTGVREELSRSGRLFLIFWAWLITVSLLVGTLLTGDYLNFLRKGTVGLLWIVESWRLWGICVWILFVYRFAVSESQRSFRFFGHAFFYIAFVVVLLSGFIPYFQELDDQSLHSFGVFSGRKTNSVKILNLFLPFMLVSAIEPPGNSRIVQFFAGLLFVLGSVAVFFTGSRAGYLAYLLACGILVLGYLIVERDWTGKLLLCLLVLIPSVVFWVGLPDQLSLKLQKRMSGTSWLNPTETFRYRKIWPLAGDLVVDRPILGYGAGTYYRQAEMKDDDNLTNIAKVHPHNIWLQVLYQGGLIALVLFLLFVYYFVLDTFGRYWKKQGRNLLYLSAGATFVSMVLFHGLVEVVNWAYVALILSQYELARFDDEHSENTS